MEKRKAVFRTRRVTPVALDACYFLGRKKPRSFSDKLSFFAPAIDLYIVEVMRPQHSVQSINKFTQRHKEIAQ